MKTKFIENKKVKGFTIVELLVVIVVIGILAAITIVSYTGISNKAKTARAQNNANSIMKVAQVYNIDPTKNVYPTQPLLVAYTTGVTKIPNGVSVVAGGLNVLSAAVAETTIAYQNNGNIGACIGYYDITTSSVKYIFAGTASAASLNIAAPTCT